MYGLYELFCKAMIEVEVDKAEKVARQSEGEEAHQALPGTLLRQVLSQQPMSDLNVGWPRLKSVPSGNRQLPKVL